ncbi:hypothetical protein ABK040_003262 [Willaertia magna]
MNATLLSTQTKERVLTAYPESMEEKLNLGYRTGTAVKFNERGNLLAIGCYDGIIKIYDFDTCSEIIELSSNEDDGIVGHTSIISCIDWFKNYRYLLSSGYDNKVMVWDIIEKEPINTFEFESPMLKSYINPTNQDLILCCPTYEIPELINIRTGKRTPLPITKYEFKAKSKHDFIGGRFTVDGKYIFIGNSVGQIIVIDVNTLQIVRYGTQPVTNPFHISEDININLKSKQVQNRMYAISQLEFSKKGNYIAVNCNVSIQIFRYFIHEDKVDNQVRKSVNFYLLHEFKPVVAGETYLHCHFSGTVSNNDSNYLIASNGANIYIYDYVNGGELVKLLECPYRESILCMEWHPQNFKYIKPTIAVSTKGGCIYIWSRNIPENWSAFAPDFDEIEINETYIEREEEYDMEDETDEENDSNKNQTENHSNQQNGQELIDIFTIPPSELEYVEIPIEPIKDSDMRMLLKIQDENDYEPAPTTQKRKRNSKKKNTKKKKKQENLSSSDSEYIDD